MTTTGPTDHDGTTGARLASAERRLDALEEADGRALGHVASIDAAVSALSNAHRDLVSAIEAQRAGVEAVRAEVRRSTALPTAAVVQWVTAQATEGGVLSPPALVAALGVLVVYLVAPRIVATITGRPLP